MVKPFIPSDEVLREVGRVVIRHGQLDHALRLAIKRVVGVSIADPLYAELTRGMTGVLRTTLKKKIEERYGARATQKDLMGQTAIAEADRLVYKGQVLFNLLDRAKEVSDERNWLVHGLWAQENDKTPVIIDKEGDYTIPTVETLRVVEMKIDELRRVVDGITRNLIMIELDE